MKFIFLSSRRPGKQWYYAVPLIPGWEDLLAEWRPDILCCQKNRRRMVLSVGEIRANYAGLIYWGRHKELGIDNQAIRAHVASNGIPVAHFQEKRFVLTGENYMYELLIPARAIARIRPATQKQRRLFQIGILRRSMVLKKQHPSYSSRTYEAMNAEYQMLLRLV